MIRVIGRSAAAAAARSQTALRFQSHATAATNSQPIPINRPLRSFHSIAPRLASSPPSTSLSGSSPHIPPRSVPPPRSSHFWSVLFVALCGTGLYCLIDYAWVRSDSKKRIEARIGLPVDILHMLKDARQSESVGAAEKERVEERARHHREEQRRHDKETEEDTQAHTETESGEDKNPLSLQMLNECTSDDFASSRLIELTPSLVDAERIYRQVLSRLNFRGIDLTELHAWVAEGTPTPAMRSVGQEVDPATKKLMQYKINSVLDPPNAPGATPIDKRLLPFVLQELARNLQSQGEVLKALDDISHDGPSPLRPSTASAAYRKYVASESYYLQALTLYRHHFQSDPRPYSLQVLNGLGTLYFDMGEMSQAEAVWIKCLDILQAARRAAEGRSAPPTTTKANNKSLNSTSSPSDDSDVTDLTSSSLPSSYARLASDVTERLSMLHRNRGEYSRSVQWLQQALAEWDAYSAQVRQSAVARPTQALSPVGSTSLSPAKLAQFEAAIQPLPRAMHLLTALSADFATAHKSAESYQVCMQSFEVLDRIMQLVYAASGTRITPTPTASDDAAQNNTNPSTSSLSLVSPSEPHSKFLSPDFTHQLREFIQQQAQAEPPTMLSTINQEAAAAYYNLAIILKSMQLKDDAKASMAQAKRIARIHRS